MRHAAPATTTASLLEAQGRIWRVALNVFGPRATAPLVHHSSTFVACCQPLQFCPQRWAGFRSSARSAASLP